MDANISRKIVKMSALFCLIFISFFPGFHSFAQRSGCTKEEIARRRHLLMEQAKEGVIVLFGEFMAPGSSHFRQDNDFFYFTNCEESDAILMMRVKTKKSLLFLPYQSDREVRFHPANPLKDPKVREKSGFDDILPLDRFDEIMSRHAARSGATLYLRLSPRDTEAGSRRETLLLAARKSRTHYNDQLSPDQYRLKKLKERYPSLQFKDIAPLIDSQRLIKTPEEIEILRRNGKISAQAIKAAMGQTRPGNYEYELEAAALHVILKHGARGPAYPPIVGSGPNACILHYDRSSRQIEEGDLVLMDFGADLDYLCMDISRTWPASGIFTPEQREAYQVALAVQKACIEAYRPGVTGEDVQKYVASKMKKMGLDPRGLKGGIGHYVGMATHDVGPHGVPLREGMVFAIEPGLYDREKNICIRIEDTVLITKEGCEVLSGDVPKEIEEIEALMAAGPPVSSGHIAAAERLIGLSFTEAERELMLEDVQENLASYRKLRAFSLENSLPPALYFNPLLPGSVPVSAQQPAVSPDLAEVELPRKPEEIAFLPVTALAYLIQSRKITSTELTKLYLQRLKTFGPKLECVVSLTEELAMDQARQADAEIAAGQYRGPLHGIPWGAKDLLATKGIKTTWGAEPYKDQVIDEDAAVVIRLRQAGAVLVAKLTSGALAWGDVWFGGWTRNPWNLEQGSSGSSAGPASATAAGLVGFAIGTETWGSIVSPATRCGATGLRPTFGRVSRHGAMALSWSMDKIGPICRSVEDCALVFQAICGPDGKDPTVMDYPFDWNPRADIKTIRVGYLKTEFDKERPNKENDEKVLRVLRSMGIEPVPLDLPDFPVEALSFILNAEAAAAFDELTRSGKDDRLKRQIRHAWPNVFRHSRLIPAVEYIQANRFRTRLMQEMVQKLKAIDVYVAPSFGGHNLLLTNLTGHPAVVVPNGFNEKGSPTSITFIGNLFEEAKILSLARAFQQATPFHLKHPPLTN